MRTADLHAKRDMVALRHFKFQRNKLLHFFLRARGIRPAKIRCPDSINGKWQKTMFEKIASQILHEDADLI